MRATRRPNRRRVVPALAAVLLLGACGRGASEQRVASRGSEPGTEVTEVTEVPPPVETSTTTTPPDPTRTTAAPEPPTTTPSTAPRPTSTTSTTAKPKAAGDRCASPSATDVALTTAGGKPTDLALAADGAIWFTDTGASAIGRLAPDGTVRMFPLSAGRDASSIAIGPAGDVWFTQYAFYKTAEFGPPPPPPGPPAIGRIFADGTMTEYPLPTIDSNRAGRADPLSGAAPGGITAGPDGAMWFTEGGADQIGRIGPEGVITEYPLPSRQTEHGQPSGLVPGPDGALWFNEAFASKIGRIDPATMAITEHTLSRAGSSPMEWGSTSPLVEGPDGAFWFSDWATTITRVTTAGETTSFRVAPPADGIRSMVAGPDGQLWFADQRSPALFRMTRKGVVTQLWIPPGAPKAYESLSGMAVAPDGSVWIAQPWANKITRLSCRG